MGCAVIFGGNGFIGSFFAKTLLDTKKYTHVYLYDIEPIKNKISSYRKAVTTSTPGLTEVIGDVRKAIDWQPTEVVSLIANFAAVHREPGHEGIEYYETNLLGAENVCNWAERVGCNNIIFTSSISPYGPSEVQKNESSIPSPNTPYGGSKLAAEKIHQIWQARGEKDRHLVIARPGVVFGPGEGGNVSRLIKAVLRRYFFYMGNQNTRKAGVYVKELCNAMLWVFNHQIEKNERITTFNMSMNPGPSIKEYVDTVCKVANIQRKSFAVPFHILLTTSYIIELIARPLGIQHPFSPVRIRKLVRSNNISPDYLINNNYNYIYTLESAFLDWKKEYPKEWS